MNILFLCTSNLHRSRTAEDYFQAAYPQHSFKSAGLSEKNFAKHGTSLCCVELLEWADKVYVMESMHRERIQQHTGVQYLSKIETLNIEDVYQYMQSELIEVFQQKQSLLNFNLISSTK